VQRGYRRLSMSAKCCPHSWRSADGHVVNGARVRSVRRTVRARMGKRPAGLSGRLPHQLRRPPRDRWADCRRAPRHADRAFRGSITSPQKAASNWSCLFFFPAPELIPCPTPIPPFGVQLHTAIHGGEAGRMRMAFAREGYADDIASRSVGRTHYTGLWRFSGRYRQWHGSKVRRSSARAVTDASCSGWSRRYARDLVGPAALAFGRR